MSNNAEQYTVKTPEDMIRKHLAMMPEDNWYYQEPVKQAILDYSSELIKENERLRGRETKLVEDLTEALTYHHIENIRSAVKRILSKHQPIKKDEIQG